MPRAVALLPLLLALLLAGCTRPAADAEDLLLEDTLRLPAGRDGFLEVNLLVEEGTAIAFSWSASGSLAFDVHVHDAEGVQYLQQATSQSGGGNVTAPADGALSFLWLNRGADAVDLHYDLAGAFRLDSIHGPPG